MAEKTIKQKIELTGEKEYKAAISDATRQLKVLQSQLKAESAELGRNATEQQKNEVKAKSLAKQIAAQEKIVETLQKELAQAKKEYGDNTDVVSKYEIKLNSARTTLGKMRSSLESATGGLSGAAEGFKKAETAAENGVVATRSFAEALGTIADAGGAVADKIQGIFTGMVSTVKDAIADVWADTVELAGRANEWADLAGFWNTSAANIQKWYHSVSASHNDFATMTQAVTRIVMADQKKIEESTGVAAEGYADQWAYAMDVMDSLAGMDYDKKLAALGDIFGERRATGVLDLLNDWQTIQENLEDFDVEKGGVGMSEEQMSTMAELAETVDHIKETWKSFKDSFTAKTVGQLSLDLTGNVQGALDALISFMDADTEAEREAALEDFTTNITEFFTRLGEAITEAAEALGTAGEEMQGSENGIVRALGDVLVALRDVMAWFAEEGNIDLVIKGFEALAAFWLAGKGAKMVGTIASLVENFNVLKAFKLGSGAAGAAGGAAAGGGAGGGAAGGAGFWASAKSLIAGNGLSLLVPGAVTAAALAPGIAAQKQDEATWKAEQAAREAAAAEAEKILGQTEDTTFIKAAAEANGPKRRADGSYETDATGLFLNMGPTDSTRELLMGLASRQNQQKAELANTLRMFAEPTAGNDTWGLLQRYWSGEALDSFVEDELLGNITDALAKSVAAKAGQAAGDLAEDVMLGTDRASMEGAIQDWWDAWKDNDLNPTEEGAAEEDREWGLMQEMLGDSFGDVWDRILQGLDETEDQHALEDIPEGWYRDILDSLDFGEKEGGVTSDDLSALQGLPALIQAATESGAASGVSGIQVQLDGYSVGRLVAPYVSREIGRSIITMR